MLKGSTMHKEVNTILRLGINKNTGKKMSTIAPTPAKAIARCAMLTIIVLGMMLSFTACVKTNKTQTLGTEMLLNMGDQGTVSSGGNKLGVQFVDLIEDSRCPEGMFCTWAGRVLVSIKFQDQMFTLMPGSTISTEFPNTAIVGDHTLTLLEVLPKNPLPAGNQKKYCVKIMVTKK
jgi:hypothetical protein